MTVVFPWVSLTVRAAWPQMVTTPAHCPPAPLQSTNPDERNRLHQIWAAGSSDWNLASPALFAAFPSGELPSPLFQTNLSTDVSREMNWLTADAIAAGTPTYNLFNGPDLGLGTSFSSSPAPVPAEDVTLTSLMPDRDYFNLDPVTGESTLFN